MVNHGRWNRGSMRMVKAPWASDSDEDKFPTESGDLYGEWGGGWSDLEIGMDFQ